MAMSEAEYEKEFLEEERNKPIIPEGGSSTTGLQGFLTPTGMKEKADKLTSEIRRLRRDVNIAKARLGTKDERVSDREWVASTDNNILDMQEQLDELNRQAVVSEKKGIETEALAKEAKEESYGKSLVDRLLNLEKEISPVSEEQRKQLRGTVETSYAAMGPEVERAIKSEVAKRGGLYSGGYLGALTESASKREIAKQQALSDVEKYLDQLQSGKRAEARSGLTTALGTISQPTLRKQGWEEYLRTVPQVQTGGAMPPKAPEWWEPLVEAGGDVGAYALGTALGGPVGGTVAKTGWDWLKESFKPKKAPAPSYYDYTPKSYSNV